MRGGFFVVGLLVGVVAGVVGAFIFAPEATNQLRTRLRPTASRFDDNHRVETVEHLDDQRIILNKGKPSTLDGDS